MTIVCKQCGKEYVRHKSQVRWRGSSFCSVTCRNVFRRVEEPKSDVIDRVWQQVVKCRDGYKCLYCGSEKYLNAHHLFSRTNWNMRWEPLNGITLCAGHHMLLNSFSAHKTPIEFLEWLQEKMGAEWYEKLRALAKRPKTEESPKEALLRLKEEYRRISGELNEGL